MKVLAVTSRSLLDTRWINLSIRVFSPREFLCGLFGIVSVLAAISGKIHPALAIFGILVMIFGFIPFGFLSPEKQLLSFFTFHAKKDNGTKKLKKEKSEHVGIGTFAPEENLDDDDDEDNSLFEKGNHTARKTDDIETVLVENLDVPYTLNLKTSAKMQFIPVSIFFSDPSSSLQQQQRNEIHVASTTTSRNGKIFCTIMLEEYGKKRVRVVSDDNGSDQDGDNGNSSRKVVVFYDKTVVFQRK